MNHLSLKNARRSEREQHSVALRFSQRDFWTVSQN